MPPVKKVKATKNSLKEEAKDEKPAVQPVISEQLTKKLLKEQKRQEKKERGIVLIKHLPHGFFEEQLKQYFQQFGTVTRLRLVRSRRTGGSKGFAFVEFEYPEVAQIAAETMDNYLMFQKLVKAAYIPPDKQRYNYFKSSVRKIKNKAGKTIYVSSKTAAIKRKVDQHNEWSEENTKKRTESNIKKIKKLSEKYKDLGIDFSSICLAPKVTANNNLKKNKVNNTDEANEKPIVTKKSQITENKKNVKSSPEQIFLQDLLGNTLPEDSDDGDWSGSDIEESGDYEETLSFESNDEDDVEEEKEIVRKLKQKPKKLIKAPTNDEKVDFLLKRKPQAGGIKKMGKKTTNKKIPLVAKASNTKNSMLLLAAKEVAKPMSKTTLKKKGKLASKMGVN